MLFCSLFRGLFYLFFPFFFFSSFSFPILVYTQINKYALFFSAGRGLSKEWLVEAKANADGRSFACLLAYASFSRCF